MYKYFSLFIQREINFNLYIVLHSSIKYTFALSHYNYARWLNLLDDDLLKLEYICSDMYKEFCNGIFAVSKSENPFSSMTIDQAHKQNVFIKGVGGAARLLAQDRDGALW